MTRLVNVHFNNVNINNIITNAVRISYPYFFQCLYTTIGYIFKNTYKYLYTHIATYFVAGNIFFAGTLDCSIIEY